MFNRQLALSGLFLIIFSIALVFIMFPCTGASAERMYRQRGVDSTSIKMNIARKAAIDEFIRELQQDIEIVLAPRLVILPPLRQFWTDSSMRNGGDYIRYVADRIDAFDDESWVVYFSKEIKTQRLGQMLLIHLPHSWWGGGLKGPTDKNVEPVRRVLYADPERE